MSAARVVPSAEYGEELALRVEETGCEIRSDSGGEACLFGGEYVRIVAPDGREIGYWDHAEWAREPKQVMGAILAAASGREVLPFDSEEER